MPVHAKPLSLDLPALTHPTSPTPTSTPPFPFAAPSTSAWTPCAASPPPNTHTAHIRARTHTLTAPLAPCSAKTLSLDFLRSPVEVLGDEQGRARAVRLEKTQLVPQEGGGDQRAEGTGEFETIEADLVSVLFLFCVCLSLFFGCVGGWVGCVGGWVSEWASV